MNLEDLNKYDSFSTDEELFYEDIDTIYGHAEEYLGEWVTVWVGNKKEIKPRDLLYKYTVETILEQMSEGLYYEVGELAEGRIHLSTEHEQELQEIISKFLDIHCDIITWSVKDIEELQVRMVAEGSELEIKQENK